MPLAVEGEAAAGAGASVPSSGAGWQQAAAGGGMILAPILDTIISANASKKAQARQNAANMQMADYSYSKNLEQWNRMNDYNSPANQMKRFSDAGLNPNLIYGQGSSGNAGTMAAYQAPTLEYKGYTPKLSGGAQGLAAYQDYQMRQAQVDNVRASTENLHERTKTEVLQQIAATFGNQFLGDTMPARTGSEYAKLHGLRIGNNDALNKELLSRIASEWSGKEHAQRYESGRIVIERSEIEKRLRDMDLTFKQLGIGENDNAAMRVIARLLDQLGLLPNWIDNRQ